MTAMPDLQSATDVVYVKLLDEGTDVYRPAPAIRLQEEVYRLLEPELYDVDAEEWEFIPGSVVRCKLVKLDEDFCLIAEAPVVLS